MWLKLLWTGNLKRINVPRLENVSIWDIYESVCLKNGKIWDYFPDYGLDKDGYLPQWDYFWNIFNSID